MELKDGVPAKNLPSGLYQYKATVVTGPVVLAMSDDDGANFDAITDGSFASDADGVVYISSKNRYQATVPAGDRLTINMVDNGHS